ncbi:MAG: hypothetical protein AAF502_07750 [Bacteroidota bacterium]
MNWEKFKNNMHDHESQVDPNEIWGAIEPEVNVINKSKKDKRRFLLFWLFGGLGVSLISTLVIWSMNTGQITKTDQMSMSEATNQTETLADGEPESSITESISEANSGNNLNAEFTKENDTPGNVDTNGNSETLATGNEGFPVTEDSNLKGESSSEKTTENFKNHSHAVQENKVGTDEALISLPEMQELINEEGSVINNSALPNDNETIAIFEEGQGAMQAIYVLPTQAISLTDVDDRSILSNLFDFASNFPLPILENNYTQKPFSFGVSAIGGASLVNRQFSQKDSAAIDLITLRESTEKTLEAHHYGLMFSLKHKSGFSLTTGIQRTSIAERFDYNESFEEVITIQGIDTLFVDINLDTIAIMGEIPMVRTTTFNNRNFNTHKLLDIPFLIGYERQFGKWNLGARAGILANLAMKSEGRILQDPSNILEVELQETPIYRPNIGLSYQFGLHIRREILPNLDLSFSPMLRVLPNDFSSSSYNVSQKYTLFGGQIGLTFRIGD